MLTKLLKESKILFVSGIDTGIGKTYITGYLAKEAVRLGIDVTTIKLIQTGCSESVAEDVVEHRTIMGQPLTEEDRLGLTSPVILKYPSSPELAASMEHRIIEEKNLIESVFSASLRHRLVIVEGSGGLLVPINDRTLLAQVIKRAGWPLLLVSTPRLGSINQTLLNFELIQKYSIPFKGLIYNKIEPFDPHIAEDTLSVFIREIHNRYHFNECKVYEFEKDHFKNIL